MAKKAGAGQALQTFVMELGVPEELVIDGSKEQNAPGTEFMNCRFCLLYYLLILVFLPYPLYSLVQDKNHDPCGNV